MTPKKCPSLPSAVARERGQHLVDQTGRLARRGGLRGENSDLAARDNSAARQNWNRDAGRIEEEAEDEGGDRQDSICDAAKKRKKRGQGEGAFGRRCCLLLRHGVSSQVQEKTTSLRAAWHPCRQTEADIDGETGGGGVCVCV